MQYDFVIQTKMTYKNKNKIIISTALIAIVFVLSSQFAHASEITSENIINAVNKERESRMLAPLKANDFLTDAALTKSRHMILNNYFEHYAYGLTPWSFILNSGYDYSIAGENLAMGFSSAEGVVDAWMDSPSHRANILNPDYQDIGVGVVKGEFTENGETKNITMITEMLAKPKPMITRIFDRINDVFNNMFR